MRTRRIMRGNEKSPADRAKERALREQVQRTKPALEDMLASGDCDASDVMSMGTYVNVQQALQELKQLRSQGGLSVTDVAKHSGLDRAVVSRLENGKLDNPTVATLSRYAAALGQRFTWAFEQLPPSSPRRHSRSASLG